MMPEVSCVVALSNRGRKAGLVQAAKGGALAGAPGEREYYRVKRDEVNRVIRELPIPPTGETLGERLARFAKREGNDLPSLAYACNQIALPGTFRIVSGRHSASGARSYHCFRAAVRSTCQGLRPA